ncbi:site-specific integrase, partial [Aromatoleum anaerobium]|uniref:site-specific integrase n=1 Tax=Aromatoleum anaerobium TaxID=182180 RepID=UPI00145ECC22
MARSAKLQAHDGVLLAAFCQWMRQQRGTADSTLYNYKRSLRDLLARVDEDPGALDAERLRRFVLETSQKSGWAATKKCTTALRMFLRFLIAEGRCAAELGAAVPTVAHWRLSALPRYLQSEDVDRLIASCDRTSA